jgi:hypothetical protein
MMAVLVAVFVGRRGIVRLTLVLGLASVVTVAVFVNPSLTTAVDVERGEPTNPIGTPSVNLSSNAPRQPDKDPTTAISASSAPNKLSNPITVSVDPTAASVVAGLARLVKR